jgi:hypothetical protein
MEDSIPKDEVLSKQAQVIICVENPISDLLNNNLSGPIAEAVNQSFMYTVQCH